MNIDNLVDKILIRNNQTPINSKNLDTETFSNSITNNYTKNNFNICNNVDKQHFKPVVVDNGITKFSININNKQYIIDKQTKDFLEQLSKNYNIDIAECFSI